MHQLIRRAAVEALENRRLLAAVSWDGGGDGSSWGDADNWSDDSVPTAADDVTIDVAGTVVLTGTRPAGSLDLDGGTLAITGTAATGSGILSVGDLAVAAGAEVVLTSTASRLARVDVSGTYVNNGTLTAEPAGGGGRDVVVRSGATFANDGTLTAGVDFDVLDSGAGTAFANTGAIDVAGTARVDVTTDAFDFSGTAAVAPGGVLFHTGGGVLTYDGGSHNGRFEVRGVDLDLVSADVASTLVAIGSNTLVRHAAADLTLAVEGTVATGSVILDVESDLTTTGPIVLTSTAARLARIDVAAGVTYTNAGVITAEAAGGGMRDVVVRQDATFVNNGTVVVDAGVDFDVLDSGAGSTFDHNGLATVGDAGRFDVTTDFFMQSGTFDVGTNAVLFYTGGLLRYDGGSHDGRFEARGVDLDLVAADAAVRVAAIGTNALVRHDAADIELAVEGTANNGSALLTVESDLTTTGPITLTSAAARLARIDVAAGVTYANDGVITAEAAGGGQRDVLVRQDATFVNDGGLVVAAGVDFDVLDSGAGGEFANTGLATVGDGGRLDVTIDLFTQAGTIDVAANAELFFTAGGRLSYEGGSHSGRFVVRGVDLDLIAADGPVEVTAIGPSDLLGLADADFTLAVTGTAASGSAILNVTGDTANLGTIELTSDAPRVVRLVVTDGTFVNDGTLRLVQAGGGTRGFFQSGDGEGFVNEGTIELLGGFTVDGNAPFENRNLIVKRDAGAVTWSAPLDNAADVDVEAGAFELTGDTNLNDPAGGFLSGGRYDVANGARLGFGAAFQLPLVNTADVSVSGSGVVEFGRLRVNRGAIRLLDSADLTIDPTAGNSPGLDEVFANEGILDLSPGSTLSVDGDARFDGGSQPVLRSEIAGPGDFGRFDVTGTLDLDAAPSTTRFDPDLVGGFDPAVGDRFGVITAGSIAGAFDSFQGGLDPSGDILTAEADATSVDVVIAPGPLPPPPQVLSQAFEFETRQAVVFQFDQDVSAFLGRGDFTLVNTTTGQTIDGSVGVLTYNQASNRAVFDFTNAVPDGDYRLTIGAGDIANSAGVPASGSPIVLDFFVLAGDFNRDRAVNLSDFTILANNFGQDGRTFSQGDANYDGVVNLSDFTILANRFGTTLPPPAGDGDDGLFA